MALSDMTPFDALRATFEMGPDDTEATVACPEGLTAIVLKLERVEEPHGETLTLKMSNLDAPKLPRIDIPVITQTERNGRVWVKTKAAGIWVEADNLAVLGLKLGQISDVTGFCAQTLRLLRQAGGDGEFFRYFRRV